MSKIFNSALKNIGRRLSTGGIDTKMRFSLEPYGDDSGFGQWHDAMRMVSRLTGGIPNEFRQRLWLTLAERHIQTRKVNWPVTSRLCFNDKCNPDDDALGTQIVKDLHRTGCSLFSGDDSEHNQALLKQVLLAYARWNKNVGYCQGFNMLAAIIIEVMQWNVENSLKVMIYLIEGVLPESYFANNLRGLSVDMAVFRELLRLRLSLLAKHLDRLQYEAGDSSSGTSYEPPLINVFTMQWFLTLFSNCLPKTSVLRIWDLIFLEGNEVLLRTALAIWDCLEDRIMTVESADEFYSIMGVLTREMMEFGLTDTNELVKTICLMAPFPFPQLHELREKYTYNIRPLTSSLTLVKKGLQIFQSDDEDDIDPAEDQIMVATWCLSNGLSPNKSRDQVSGSRSQSLSTSSNSLGLTLANISATNSPNFLAGNAIDSQRMSLDISLLKKQYAKLKERQRQAHIILTEGFQHANNKTFAKRQPVKVNHLLLGKTALTNRKPKRPSPVLMNQIKPGSQGRKTMPARSKTVTNLLPRITAAAIRPTSSSSKSNYSGETLTWSQLKLEKKREQFTRKLSEPSMSVCRESAEERADDDAVDFILEQTPSQSLSSSKALNAESDNDADDSSGNSSSTELCDSDDLQDNLTDHSPSPTRSLKLNNGRSDIYEIPKHSENIKTSGANESAKQCLTDYNDPLDESKDSQANRRIHAIEIIEEGEEFDDDEKYSAIKRELSNLSVEECIQRLNEKMSSLAN